MECVQCISVISVLTFSHICFQVIEAAHSVNPGLICMACGSYRRGKPTCGDVDVLITHPDGKSHRGIFHKVLNKLRDSGMSYKPYTNQGPQPLIFLFLVIFLTVGIFS